MATKETVAQSSRVGPIRNATSPRENFRPRTKPVKSLVRGVSAVKQPAPGWERSQRSWPVSET